MKKGYWFLLSFFVIILDQISKYLVIKNLIPFKPVSIFPMLNLTLAYNTGAAFGFLNRSGLWHKWFFAAFSLSMSVVLILWLWRVPKKETLYCAALSLILGGAMGNLMDRINHGFVIDFIDFYYNNYHFATFNIADSAICIGAALLFIDFCFPKKVKSLAQQQSQ